MAKADLPLLRPQAGEGAWGDPSSSISYKISQGEENPASQQVLEIWERWEGGSTEMLTAQQDAAHWGNWFYQHGAIPLVHTQPFSLPPVPTMRLHWASCICLWTGKKAIRNFLKKSCWRNQCRYIELLGSRLPVYVWECGFLSTELWQRTHLEGHTGADRMDRQQKLDSQAVPWDTWLTPYPDPAAALLSRRWIQLKKGFLSLLYQHRGANRGHLLSQGTGAVKEVLSFLMWQFSSKPHAAFSPHSMTVKYDSLWCPR